LRVKWSVKWSEMNNGVFFDLKSCQANKRDNLGVHDSKTTFPSVTKFQNVTLGNSENAHFTVLVTLVRLESPQIGLPGEILSGRWFHFTLNNTQL